MALELVKFNIIDPKRYCTMGKTQEWIWSYKSIYVYLYEINKNICPCCTACLPRMLLVVHQIDIYARVA
jgi:hypothetical protein